MADSIPEELRSFGVTSNDFDEKKVSLQKLWGLSLLKSKSFSRFGNKSNKLSNIAAALLEFRSLHG
jgi:hypothetical protein